MINFALNVYCNINFMAYPKFFSRSATNKTFKMNIRQLICHTQAYNVCNRLNLDFTKFVLI